MSELRKELLDRYEATGKVGFSKPTSKDEALRIIDTIVELYEGESDSEEYEEVIVTLSEITEKLKTFFDKF